LFLSFRVVHNGGDQSFRHEHGKVELRIGLDDVVDVGIVKGDAAHDSFDNRISLAHEDV
jgi:hypothetical protein